MRLYGIDPASESWTVVEAAFDPKTEAVTVPDDANQFYRMVRYEALEEFAKQCADRKTVAVLDSPLCWPRAGHWLLKGYYKGSKTLYPFNCKPFSQRPVEKALSVIQSANFVAKELVASLKSLTPTGESLAKYHRGVSVLGYSGVTHWSPVAAFLESAGTANFDPAVRDAQLTILESHPVVNLALWLSGAEMPKYKDDSFWSAKVEVGIAVKRIEAICGITLPRMPKSDDELDALVGLAAAVDYARGEADWIGDCEDGYVMMPGERKRKPWHALYADAKSAVRSEITKRHG